MRYLTWLLRSLLFIVLLGFAVKNDQPVTLRYFFGYEWQTPLVVALLAVFTVGAAIGVTAVSVTVIQLRREIARLKRDVKTRNKLADIKDQHTPIQPS